MDRGIPTEEVLEEMRQSNPKVDYLVGTPKGRLTHYEKRFLKGVNEIKHRKQEMFSWSIAED